jgi:MYXO-CTERM domain-containing protein
MKSLTVRRTPLVLSTLALAALMAAAGASAAPVVLEAGKTVTGEAHLITSNPGTFTGVNVANLIGANRFYNAGITGQNSVAANVEAGHIWNGHETLRHVTSFANHSSTWQTVAGQPEYDRHATWVGMMIGGRSGGGVANGPWQTGIAPGTDLRSGAIATQFFGPAYGLSFNSSVQAIATAYASHFGSADVINSSWGGTDPGGTSVRATIPDGLANQNRGTTFVASAGNAGPNAGTVGSPGSGYNVITVGALQNVGNVYNTLASFSSRGPMPFQFPDGSSVAGVRAAVDIVAPGTTLTAAFYGGQTGGNNPTLTNSTNSPGDALYSSGVGGTSFAAPITAGGAALLVSGSRQDAALVGNDNARDGRVIKAVLLNSADKIPGWNNGQTNVGGVISTTQSLDWNTGAGALNLDRAYDQFLAAGTRDVTGLGGGSVQVTGWDFGETTVGGEVSYALANMLLGGSVFTVTLDWYRERSFNAQTLVTQDIGQANFDLFIRDLDSDTIVAQSISTFNNVEHLNFIVPKTGRYGIEVSYVGNLFGDLRLEQFGLAWFGTAAPNVDPDPLSVPGTWALLLLGLGLAARSRRRAH